MVSFNSVVIDVYLRGLLHVCLFVCVVAFLVVVLLCVFVRMFVGVWLGCLGLFTLRLGFGFASFGAWVFSLLVGFCGFI